MKYLSSLFAMLLLGAMVTAQTYKPYILGAESSSSIQDTKESLVEAFNANGIQELGGYQPAGDANRWVVVFSSKELINAVKKIGGETGFAAALRIGITKENGKVLVSYTNPEYWGMAYFRDDYDQVKGDYNVLANKLKNVMKAVGTYKGSGFGSEKGLDADKLKDYNYMFGMPDFTDYNTLGEFGTFAEAKKAIADNLARGVQNVQLVYSVDVPGKDLKLYGFALSGDDGEATFLPKIDLASPKHTAFLPYEILVMGNEVIMLHGRFRIALSFPDLTMGTFTKIMSTPGDIEDLLEQLVK